MLWKSLTAAVAACYLVLLASVSAFAQSADGQDTLHGGIAITFLQISVANMVLLHFILRQVDAVMFIKILQKILQEID